MGSGASVPEEPVDAETARALLGDQFDEARFDELKDEATGLVSPGQARAFVAEHEEMEPKDSPENAQRRTIADEAYARADEPLDLAGAQKILGPKLTEEEFRAMANDDGVVVRARVEMEQFTGVHALNAALENRSTVLVDGDWLLNFKGKSIPRRQDLPKKAIFSEQVQEPDNKDLKKTGQPMGFKNVVIIVVSYCWASREHPDPMGKHLAILKRVLAFMRSPKCAKEIGKKKIVIFFDWMSLYQNHGGPPRTPEQDELFGLGLREVNLWYAHMWTFKLVLSELAPPNLERPTYLDSGWTSKLSGGQLEPDKFDRIRGLELFDASCLSSRHRRVCS
jgi:hypothetical protein